MPSHTEQHYLQTHRQLKRFWDHAMSVYGHLSPTEQWILHDYFQPSKDMTDAELLKHRVEIATKRPQLPQRTGKALKKLYAAAAEVSIQGVRRSKQPPRPKYARGPRGEIKVYGVVRPEIDVEKFAKALLQIAIDMQKKGKPASDGPGGPFQDAAQLEDRPAG